MSDEQNSTDVVTNEVAKHYNRKEIIDLDARSKSRIYYLRNFNNWIKSVLINEFILKIRNEKSQLMPVILDLGCGRGGDILKWKKANVSHVTFVDIAEKSLEICKDRYFNPSRANFTSDFIHLDVTKNELKEKINNKQHDLVSSQFVIHYSFESFEQADMFLKNVSDSLKVGGYFIGTTTNDYEIIKRLRKSSDNTFGNDLYKISFTQQDKENFDLFGVQFDFQLEGVVECPEYLLNFDILVRMAQRHNLKLIFKKKFSDFYEENCQKYEYKSLFTIMKALEPYYPKNNSDSEKNDQEKSDEYDHIEELLKDDAFKSDLSNNEHYATISKSEWEAITLYLTFAFEKIDSSVKENNQENSVVEEEDTTNENSLKRKLSESEDDLESSHKK